MPNNEKNEFDIRYWIFDIGIGAHSDRKLKKTPMADYTL